jgi:hypothetical protein
MEVMDVEAVDKMAEAKAEEVVDMAAMADVV